MAYLAFADPMLPPLAGPAAPPAAPCAALSALEWSVVALAERDGPASLRPPGRLARALARLFGEQVNPRLSDPRLEALRRMAVLAWHHGYVLPSDEIAAFEAAGFTPHHYELVQDRVAAARRRRGPARRG